MATCPKCDKQLELNAQDQRRQTGCVFADQGGTSMREDCFANAGINNAREVTSGWPARRALHEWLGFSSKRQPDMGGSLTWLLIFEHANGLM